MGTLTHRFKYIVTALCVLVGFSIPATAQEGDFDQLFAQLLQADAEEHARIASQITSRWEKSGSSAMDLLYRRGTDAMESGAFDAALDHFSALIDHAPEFAEAYHARASAFFNLGMLGQALDDLRMTLVLNPRQFEAMFGIGVLMEGLDRKDEALEAYRAVTAIYPLDPDALSAIARLETELEGQAL